MGGQEVWKENTCQLLSTYILVMMDELKNVLRNPKYVEIPRQTLFSVAEMGITCVTWDYIIVFTHSIGLFLL